MGRAQKPLLVSASRLCMHSLDDGPLSSSKLVMAVKSFSQWFLWQSSASLFSIISVFSWIRFYWIHRLIKDNLSLQFSSVAQSCPTLCNPMNCSKPGLPVYHQLLEFTQTHVHRVSDAIQPSHPLSSPSLLAPNTSQHQSLFQWVNSSHKVTKVLEFQL